MVSQCTVMPNKASWLRAWAGDMSAATADSATTTAHAGECLPLKPSIPENVLPHDLHMYRCSVFCLHLRLPYFMRPAAGPHPCGHLLGTLPIRTLPPAAPCPLRMTSSTAAACLQSCLPPAAPLHEQTSPDAYSTTTCHNSLTDCDITPHLTELLSFTAPGVSAICRPFSLIPSRILGSLLLFFFPSPSPLAAPPVPPFRAGRLRPAGAQSGLNPHSVSLRCCWCVCPIFLNAMGHHGPHISQTTSKLLHLLRKIMSYAACTVPGACVTAPASRQA